MVQGSVLVREAGGRWRQGGRARCEHHHRCLDHEHAGCRGEHPNAVHAVNAIDAIDTELELGLGLGLGLERRFVEFVVGCIVVVP